MDPFLKALRDSMLSASTQLPVPGSRTCQSHVGSRVLKTTVVLIILGAIATMFRVYMLTNQSLWLDEGASLAMTEGRSLSATLESLWAIAGGDKYQPAYFAILALWRSVMGDSQFILQLLSVVPGVLTPIFIYLGVRSTFGERHAMLSALFIACSSFGITYSQEVRPYSLLLCMASLQFLVFSPALKSSGAHDRGKRALFAVVTLICSSSSIFLVLFSLTHGSGARRRVSEHQILGTLVATSSTGVDSSNAVLPEHPSEDQSFS